MMKQWIPVLFLAVANLAGGGARGADFFSVDKTTDSLILVSSETGVVTPLSFLGRDIFDVDLACANGYLYALTADFGLPVELLQIDQATFEVSSAVTITLDGQPIQYAEGLANLDGRLLATFGYNGPYYWSNAIGVIAQSGALTLLCDYVPFDAAADADGLTALANGHLLAVDSRPPGADDYRLIDLGLPPNASYTVLGTHHPYTNINDLEILDNGDLWGIDNLTHSLMRFAADGTTLETRPYDPLFTLLGLVELGCGEPAITGACCFPDGTCLVAGAQYCEAQQGIYQGDGTSCDPNPCPPTPTKKTTWGHVKSMYR